MTANTPSKDVAREWRKKELTYVIGALATALELEDDEQRDALCDIREWAKNRLKAQLPDETTDAHAERLQEILRGLYSDNVDYIVRNKLGGLNNHWMRAAREALHMDPDNIRPAVEPRETSAPNADKDRFDWLTEVMVDTIYLDDGRIIDVGGHRQRPHDIRAVIDEARRTMPVSIDQNEGSSPEEPKASLRDAATNALHVLDGCCHPAGGVDDADAITDAMQQLREALTPEKATGCTLEGCSMKDPHGHTHLLSCQIWDLTKQPKCTCGTETAAAPTNDCTTCGGLGWIQENEQDIIGGDCPVCTPENGDEPHAS